jgi:WD40 repeat protein
MSMFLIAFLLAVLPAALRAESPFTAVVLSPDYQQVLLGSQEGISIRSWPDLTFVATIQTELIHIHDMRYSPDGSMILAAGGSPSEKGMIEVLGWPERKLLRREECQRDVVYSVSWSPDGSLWAAANADGTCQVFETSTGLKLSQYEGHSQAVLSLRFLPDSQMIASTGLDQTVRLWESRTGKHVRTLDNHVNSVTGIAVRPSNANKDQQSIDGIKTNNMGLSLVMVATISEDKTVRLWQPTIGRLIRFARLPSIPRSLAWSVLGDRLYVGCNDGHVRIIDPDSMEVVQDLVGIEGRIHEIVIDPNKASLLIAGEGVRRIALQ